MRAALHAGKPLSKCGKCKRYMKYISQRPSRLYCPTCEEVYPVPQVGCMSPLPISSALLKAALHASCDEVAGISIVVQAVSRVMLL